MRRAKTYLLLIFRRRPGLGSSLLIISVSVRFFFLLLVLRSRKRHGWMGRASRSTCGAREACSSSPAAGCPLPHRPRRSSSSATVIKPHRALQAAALHALMSLAVSCFSYYYYLLSFSALQYRYDRAVINSSFGYYSFSLRWCRFSPQATAWSAVAS
jgi:hypothetical protein